MLRPPTSALFQTFLAICVGLLTFGGVSAERWKPAGDVGLSRWAKQLDPNDVWNQYPRPAMRRDRWSNLNGSWDYAITAIDGEKPQQWNGKILVPFAIESPLSGVGRRLSADQALWYRVELNGRTLQGLRLEKTERIRLHFEAVDYQCEVWWDGKSLGKHVGGNLPFSFLVDASAVDQPHELVVKVTDATDAVGKYQLRGKQKVNNKGIFYTPVSGIWQTVWLEPVAATHIESILARGDRNGKVEVQAAVVGSADEIRITTSLGGQAMSTVKGPASGVTFQISDAKLWSPDSPTLYDLTVELLDGETIVDSVESYVGLRSVGKQRDADGNMRLTLNGNVVFHWGPLDQGWWPGGLLTPPSDDAIQFEIKYLKKAGFNMIRKHIKVEPRRYYTHCDRIGMMVWQDQIEGGSGFDSDEWPAWRRLDKNHDKASLPKAWKPGQPEDATWPDWAHQRYMVELKGMVDHLGIHPSIVTWVPFNERWGQHRSMKVGEWISHYDPTRLINIASGGNFFPVGDMADEHVYPHPNFPIDDTRYDNYAKIVGEFGGHGWPVPGHLWNQKKRNWGYGGLPKTKQEYIERYRESIKRLGKLKQRGVAGGVYTQTTDVEGEINGLMTYDREVIKISAGHLRQMAEEAGLIEKPVRVSAKPNVIVILVDDMGYSDIGCYGGEIETPNIDALAAGGLRFTQFYNQGRCCPTRASLMTGLQPHQTGIGHMTVPPGDDLGITGPYQGFLNDNCTTIAEVLKSSGYRTLMTGKWHLGANDKDCWPLQRGFEKYYGCISGAINYFKPNDVRGIFDGNDPVKVADDFYATDAFTNKAIEYIEEVNQSGEEPYFLYLAYNAPHWPLNAKWEDYQKYKDAYRGGWDQLMAQRHQRQIEMGLTNQDTRPAPHNGPRWDSLDPSQQERLSAVMAAYAGCLDNVDQNIGKLVESIRQSGELENTLILFMSDNGACQEGGRFGTGDEAMVRNPPLETTAGVRIGLNWARACNTPYRKYKHYVHEGGACTPMIAHWPAAVDQDRRGQLVRGRGYLQDIMATMLEISGATYPQEIPPCDGRSLLPILADKAGEVHFDPMFWEHEGNAAVRHGRWKLVREYKKPWELYDIRLDRTELNNLADEKPKLRNELIAMWESWAAETGVAFPERFNMYEVLKKQKQK